MAASPPNVKWFQKDNYIGLFVEVTDPKKDSLVLKLTEQTISFSIDSSSGIKEFKIRFDRKINPERYSQKIKERRIKIILAKAEDCQEEWPRLTKDKSRWLKFDVDSVDLTDEETIAARKLDDAKRKLEAEHGPIPDNAKIQRISEMLNVDELSRDIDEAEKEMYDMLRNSYLSIYNGVMAVAHFYLLLMAILRVALAGQGAMLTHFAAMGWLLKSAQQTAFLEIIHSATGLVKAPLLPTIMQVLGRAVMLFAVIDGEEELQTSVVCYLLMVSWSAIEVIRYPFYIVSLFEWYFPRLTWTRYNAWIPLYPIGITCEAILTYWCIGLVDESGRLTVSLPNVLNFSFDFTLYLKLHVLLIVIGGGYLMKSMVGHRSKGLKKLSKHQGLVEVLKRENELVKIRQKRESKKVK